MINFLPVEWIFETCDDISSAKIAQISGLFWVIFWHWATWSFTQTDWSPTGEPTPQWHLLNMCISDNVTSLVCIYIGFKSPIFLSRALASLVNPTFKWSYAILKLKVFVQYIYRFPAIPGTNFLGKIWCFWLHLNNRHSKSDVFGSMWRRHTRAAACTQLDLAHTIRWFCTFQFCTREREKKFFFLANFAKICPPKWSHAQSYLKVHTSVTRLGYFWEVLAAIFFTK